MGMLLRKRQGSKGITRLAMSGLSAVLVGPWFFLGILPQQRLRRHDLCAAGDLALRGDPGRALAGPAPSACPAAALGQPTFSCERMLDGVQDAGDER